MKRDYRLFLKDIHGALKYQLTRPKFKDKNFYAFIYNT